MKEWKTFRNGVRLRRGAEPITQQLKRKEAAWGARQFNNSRNQQLFFNEEERVDDLLIVDGCALPARCAPIPPNQTNAAYRGPSAIPLLALCVINIQFDSTKFHLWLLDSYPLHINYCYNINSNQLISSFISINKAKQSNFFDWIAGWWMKERSWWNWVALQLKSKTFQITPWAGRPTKPTLHSTHFNSFNSFHSATAWARGPSIPQRTTQSIECLHSVHSIQFKLACFAPFTNHFFFKEAKATRRSSSLY